jgi:hypothetical protein
LAPPRKYPEIEELAEALEAFLWGEWVTIGYIQKKLSRLYGVVIPVGYAHRAVQYHRNEISDSDGALVCLPAANSQWAYTITSDPGLIAEWVLRRQRTIQTQLQTVLMIASTGSRVTHGNSIEGKLARRTETMISRLVEDIEHITAKEEMAVA